MMPVAIQVAIIDFALPPEDMGAAMKPQQMVQFLEEHIVGQVCYHLDEFEKNVHLTVGQV